MVIDTLKNTQERNFRIEDAKPEDVEAMRIIAKNGWLDTYPNETYGITREDLEAVNWLEPAGLERRRKEITEKKDTIHVWVARDDKNNVIGFCKASKDGHKIGTEGQREIDAMYVLPEFKKRGVGSKLMQQALEWLGADSDVRLEVVSYNTNAIDFYKKFGFEETTNKLGDRQTQLASGKQIPRIVMMKIHQE